MENSLTVRQLCDIVDQTISTMFPDELWVRGAISGIKRSANGHVYFDLVDPDDQNSTAVLPVALFANNKHRVNAILRKSGGGVKMTDGIEIQIRGRLTYYPRQSRLQLLMSLIDPAFTLGQMTANRDRVLAALRADDLLDRNRRLPRPVLPLRLALITSARSAAAADFLHELDISAHPFEVITIDARVQGDEAVRSLVSALLDAQELPVDAIALVRGGGARTDLVAFDHEQVARTIALSTLPVVVGIGHETDRSIADEVAHDAAKTPTACARFFIDSVDRFRARVDAAAIGIDRSSHRILAVATSSLAEARSRLGRSAIRAVEQEAMRIELAQAGVTHASRRTVERLESELEAIAIRLVDLDPATTMARGWSITRGPDGRVVRSIDDVMPGDRLTTTVTDGAVRSTVDDLADGSGAQRG